MLTNANKPVHGLARWLGCAPYIIIEDINMSDEKIRWPFGGFFLNLSDEKNGTHEYEDYLKECEGKSRCLRRIWNSITPRTRKQ